MRTTILSTGLFLAALTVPATAQIEDSFGLAKVTAPGQDFGNSLAISSSGVLAVGVSYALGVPGAVELFNVSDLSYISTLMPADSSIYNGFGRHVDIEGDFLVVTAPTTDSSQPETGAAYIFRLSTQEELFKLTAQDAKAFDRFGGSVTIEGNRVVVGASGDDTAGVSGAGSVYVFDLANGEQLLKLAPNDSELSDQFGGSGLDLKDGTLAVGARQFASQDFGTSQDPGAVYLFDLETGTQLQKLIPSDGAGGDVFGTSLVLTEDKLLVGAPAHNSLRGAVYVFDLNTYEEIAKWEVGPELTRFGRSLAAQGSSVVVGAPSASSVCNDKSGWGAGYLFDLDQNIQLARLEPSGCPSTSNDGHGGWSVLMTEELTFIGMPRDCSVRAFPTLKVPTPYCTAKLSASGCAASASVNSPSLLPCSNGQDAFVVANEVEGRQTGLALVSASGAAEIPFSGGGFLCLSSPIKRGMPQFSGGTNQQCDGRFQQLINDGAAPPDGFDPGSGQTAWYQFWYRSPDAPAGSALSNAIEVDFK